MITTTLMILEAEENLDIVVEKDRKQNLFNVVWKHNQGMKTPSTNIRTNTPRYKLRAGSVAKGRVINSCFIGCTMPLSVYSPDMEGMNIRALFCFGEFPKLDEYYVKHRYSRSMSFLMRLQNIHDAHFKDRKRMLSLLAVEYELTIPT